MSVLIKSQIAALLNEHNLLEAPINVDRLELDTYSWIGINDPLQPEVWGCIQVKNRMFCVAEIRHLCIHPDHRRKGYAEILLQRSFRRAKQAGKLWIFSTTRGDNDAVTHLNEKMGMQLVSSSLNPATNRPINLWTRSLEDIEVVTHVPNVRNNSPVTESSEARPHGSSDADERG